MSRLRRRWQRRRLERCARRSGSGWSAAELAATAAAVDARRRHVDRITADLPAPRRNAQRWLAELEQAADTWPASDVAAMVDVLRLRLALLTYGR